MWIYEAHHRGTSNALYAFVHCKQKRPSLFFWNCLCWQPGLSDTLAMSSRLMGLPQRKLVGQKNSVGCAVCPEVVGWRIWDAADMWLRSVRCRSWSGPGVLGLSDSCAPWRWACSSRDKPRSYFFVPLTTRAAALSTRCSLSVVTFG